MVKTTKWRPDTCSCVITYDWDDTLPEDERVHTLNTIQKCKHHDSLDDASAYDQVLNGENRLKNYVLSDIGLGELPYAFDKSRKLEVTIPGKTQQEKDAIQSLVDSKHSGKVTIK